MEKNKLKNIIENELIKKFEFDSNILKKAYINGCFDKTSNDNKKTKYHTTNQYDTLVEIDLIEKDNSGEVIEKAISRLKNVKNNTTYYQINHIMSNMVIIELQSNKENIEQVSNEILNHINLMTLPTKLYNYNGLLNAVPFSEMNILWANSGVKNYINDKTNISKEINQEFFGYEINNDENIVCALFSDNYFYIKDDRNKIEITTPYYPSGNYRIIHNNVLTWNFNHSVNGVLFKFK